MKPVSKWLPSPAMVVALIALFLAAGGVGYAASSTINGKVLKSRSVAGNKLKKNTLTGTEINESKLGTVPRAKTADTATSAGTASTATNATHAGTADNATHATAADAVATVSVHATKIVDAAANINVAPQVQLGSKGPFSFYGECYLNGSSQTEATTFIASTSNSGMFNSVAGNSGYVTPATPESNRKLADVVAIANNFNTGNGNTDFMATDGSTTLYGIVGLAAAKNGTPPQGDGPFGPGNRCMFGEVIFG